MQTITTIGFDIAKSIFQVHCVDAEGNVVLRRQLKRRYALAFFQKLPPCLVGIEACASAHYWSRELQALGHTVRLNRHRQISKARQTVIGSAFVVRPRYLAVLSIVAWPKSARTVCKSPVPFKMWRAFVRRKDSTP